MKPKILWIEDGYREEVANLVGPVYSTGEYDLHYAIDVTKGISKIRQYQFNAIIVDIRTLPGDVKSWKDLYSKRNRDRIRARLGIELLYSLLDSDNAKIRIRSVPAWIQPSIFGILTVESYSELKPNLDRLGIKHYKTKKSTSPVTLLKDLIDEILD